MKFNSLIPELTVSNIERTRPFYVNILHLVVEDERAEDNFLFLLMLIIFVITQIFFHPIWFK